MKKEIEKVEVLELLSKHNECKKWLSEIETWQNGIQFMKELLLKFVAKLDDEQRIFEVRIFHDDLDGKLKLRLEWLIDKIGVQSSFIKLYFKRNHLKNPTELRIQQEMLRNEVDLLREEYLDLRSSFFELIKPILKKRRRQKIRENAA